MDAEQVLTEALTSLTSYAIGEGEHGIVFRLPENIDLCGKYHKLGYAPHEYAMLSEAYRSGYAVPSPHSEHPSRKIFFMDFVHGSSLEQLLASGHRFRADIVRACVETITEFNQQFTHGDLYPRNVMLEGWEVSDGVIVAGDPTIIDLYMTRPVPSREFLLVREWFRNATVSDL